MSNLGFLLIYARINARPDALCERVFPFRRRAAACPPRGRGPVPRIRPPKGGRSSGRPLSSFDVVAVSLSYENDLLNVPRSSPRAEVPRSGRIVPPPAAGIPSLSPAGSPRRSIRAGRGLRRRRGRRRRRARGGPPPGPWTRPGGDPGYLRELSAIPGVYVPGVPAGIRRVVPADRASGGLPALRAIEPLPGFPRPRRARGPRSSLPVPGSARHPVGGNGAGEHIPRRDFRGCPVMCGFCAAARLPLLQEFPLDRVRPAVDSRRGPRRKVRLIGAAVLDWRPFRELCRAGDPRPGAGRFRRPPCARTSSTRRSLGHPRAERAPHRGAGAGVRRRPAARADREARARTRRSSPPRRSGPFGDRLVQDVLPARPSGVPREEEVGGSRGSCGTFRSAFSVARGVGRMGVVTAVLSPSSRSRSRRCSGLRTWRRN